MASFELPKHGEILDIGGSKMMSDVEQRLRELFPEPTCEINDAKSNITLPDELLYTDRGLEIWNEIIFTPEFYQTHDEIAIFDNHGEEVVSRSEDGVVLIDLGAGLVNGLAVILIDVTDVGSLVILARSSTFSLPSKRPAARRRTLPLISPKLLSPTTSDISKVNMRTRGRSCLALVFGVPSRMVLSGSRVSRASDCSCLWARYCATMIGSWL